LKENIRKKYPKELHFLGNKTLRNKIKKTLITNGDVDDSFWIKDCTAIHMPVVLYRNSWVKY